MINSSWGITVSLSDYLDGYLYKSGVMPLFIQLPYLNLDRVENGVNTLNLSNPTWPKTLPVRQLSLHIGQTVHGASAFEGMPYKLYADDAEIQNGIIDKTGEIFVEHQIPTKKYKLELANGGIYNMSFVDEYENDTQNSELLNKGFYWIDGKNHSTRLLQQYAELISGRINEKEKE